MEYDQNNTRGLSLEDQINWDLLDKFIGSEGYFADSEDDIRNMVEQGWGLNRDTLKRVDKDHISCETLFIGDNFAKGKLYYPMSDKESD